MARNLVCLLLGLLVLGDAALAQRELLELLAPLIPVRTPVGPTIHGEMIDLAELVGKVVILYFDVWVPSLVHDPALRPYLASYEREKRQRLAFLQALHKAFEEVVVVGVWRGETAESLARLVDQLGLTFPAIPDPKGDIAKRFRVEYFPTIFLIDPAGELRGVGALYFNPWDLFFYLVWGTPLSELLSPPSSENGGGT